MSLSAKQKLLCTKPVGFLRLILPIAAVALVGSLLYMDDALPFSISTVWRCVSQTVNASNDHFATVVGLVPVYVALMIFGAALLGVFAGYALHALIGRFKSE